MVIGDLLWFYFADFLLFWGGWVGEIEDKVHLSPAEAEIGAELGNKYFANTHSFLKAKNMVNILLCQLLDFLQKKIFMCFTDFKCESSSISRNVCATDYICITRMPIDRILLVWVLDIWWIII